MNNILVVVLLTIVSSFMLSRSLALASASVCRAAASSTSKRGVVWKDGLGRAAICEGVRTMGTASKLIDYQHLPQFDAFDVAEVKPTVERCLEEFQNGFQELEQRFEQAEKPTYGLLFDEVEVLQAPISHVWGMLSHLTSVKTSDELRKVHEELQPKVVQVMQKVSQSVAMYDALTRLDLSELDPVQQRIVEKSIKGMQRSGIGLPEEEKEQFNKLKLRLAELSTKFSNNVLDSTKEFKLTLTEKAQVEGLTDTGLSMLAQNALLEGHKDATKENGPWVVTLDAPTFLQFMKYSTRSDLRKQLYMAYIGRASTGDVDNQPLIREILEIRRKVSAMLVYESPAHMSLESKMAGSPEEAMSLQVFMKDRAIGPARKELEELKKFAKEKAGVTELNHWDLTFWSEQQKEAKFQYSEENLRPYFPLENVLEGVFKLVNRLFGIVITPADGETSVWHEDVRFFHIKDEATGKHIGSFYFDPYARPSEKRSGAWMADCKGKSEVLGQVPVAYLICNSSPPQTVGEKKPSLMTLNEVETLFHELGHTLQHILTTVKYSDASGINNIEWDAVELPSQFMEEWLYDRKTLFSFAKHYKTKQPIPEDLYQKILASRHYNAGMFMLRQLNFGVLDLALHLNENKDIDPLDLQKQIAKDYAVMQPLDEDRFLCSFQHIFAGGYASGYYSYMWARVMSSDAFSAFEESDMDDDGAMRSLGLAFRNTVLSLGGGTHPATVFKEFRGRDPTPDALLRHSGLISSTSAQAKL